MVELSKAVLVNSIPRTCHYRELAIAYVIDILIWSLQPCRTAAMVPVLFRQPPALKPAHKGVNYILYYERWVRRDN